MSSGLRAVVDDRRSCRGHVALKSAEAHQVPAVEMAEGARDECVNA